MEKEYVLIENFNERYEISKCGEIYDYLNNRIVESWYCTNTKKHYKRVNLHNAEGSRKKYALHKLLALTFIENPTNKPLVDHLDGNSLNNSLENLRWVTETENQQNKKITYGTTSFFWCLS